jgi:hypothetical protein
MKIDFAYSTFLLCSSNKRIPFYLRALSASPLCIRGLVEVTTPSFHKCLSASPGLCPVGTLRDWFRFGTWSSFGPRILLEPKEMFQLPLGLDTKCEVTRCYFDIRTVEPSLRVVQNKRKQTWGVEKVKSSDGIVWTSGASFAWRSLLQGNMDPWPKRKNLTQLLIKIPSLGIQIGRKLFCTHKSRKNNTQNTSDLYFKLWMSSEGSLSQKELTVLQI